MTTALKKMGAKPKGQSSMLLTKTIKKVAIPPKPKQLELKSIQELETGNHNDGIEFFYSANSGNDIGLGKGQ